MTRVLLLSTTTGYQLRAFDEAAARLGVDLLLATDRCDHLADPWRDQAVPVRFHARDASVAAIVTAAATRPIGGVIAVGDRPVPLAAAAARALRIPWHSVEGAAASADKRHSRTALAVAGLPSPQFSIVPVNGSVGDSAFVAPHLPRVGFPCVLKPAGLSGSRGVIRANDPEEFGAAFRRIRALLGRADVRVARTGLVEQILVEEYIAGREYAVEAVMTRGTLQPFAIFDKPDPLVGPFFEETLYVTPSHLAAEAQQAVFAHVERAARALGLVHGPVHAECRVVEDGTVFVLEVAGRPIGGLCSRVLRFAPGAASLEDVLLRHAIDHPIGAFARESRAAAVMMIPIPGRGVFKGVRGDVAARGVAGVDDVRVTAKPDQLIEPLPEGSSYLGFIFAHGETAAAAERAVRTAHACLAFEIDREIVVSPLT